MFRTEPRRWPTARTWLRRYGGKHHILYKERFDSVDIIY